MSGVPFFPIVGLLTADAPGIFSEFGVPQWGIFDQDGQPILVSDSVGSMEYQRQYDVSNYPQEQGAFESYNKVQIPYEAKVTLLVSISREELLNTLEPIVASLQLVSVVTPEISYPSANLTQYGFRRTSRSGVTLIAVDVWCKEIRFSASSSLSSSSASSANQPQPVGGTDRPIGQVTGGSNLVAGGASGNAVSASSTQLSSPLKTGSTNAAYPTQSGPVQPVAAQPPLGFAEGSGQQTGPLPPPGPPAEPYDLLNLDIGAIPF